MTATQFQRRYGPMLSFMFALALASLVGFAPVIANAQPEDNVFGQNGSMLVFPRMTKGSFGAKPKSEVTITVNCPTGASCNPADTVLIRGVLVCDKNSNFVSRSCRRTGFHMLPPTEINTKVGSTLTFHQDIGQVVAGSNPMPVAQCTNSSLFVYVTNQLGEPLSWNGLSGFALLRSKATVSATYSGFQIQTISSLIQKDPIPGGGSGNSPSFVFDGLTQFKRVTNEGTGTIQWGKVTSVSLVTIDTQFDLSNLESYPHGRAGALQGDAAENIFLCRRDLSKEELFTGSPLPASGSASLRVFTSSLHPVPENTILGVVYSTNASGGNLTVAPMTPTGTFVETWFGFPQPPSGGGFPASRR